MFEWIICFSPQHAESYGIFVGDPTVYGRDGFVDHAFGHFRVDLGRRDVLMSQHLAQSDQRNAVHQRDRRSEGVPRKMKREVFFDAAGRRDELQAPVHYLDRGHRKDLFRPGKTFVFVQNRQRHGQQLDLVFGTCLQPVARDPPIARSILFELFPGDFYKLNP